MGALPAGWETGAGLGYQRHRPEHTLLYQIVEQHYPAFAALMSAQGRALPTFVHREFEDYLKCGRLEHLKRRDSPRSTPHAPRAPPPTTLSRQPE